MGIKKSEINLLNEYWSALNYISAGQLYLLDNPLLKRKLELKDVKHKIIGHWGTVPGQNLIYTHLNRIIKNHDLNMIYLSGPGHGGNAPVSCTYLEGTYSEIYPSVSQDEEGLKKLFKQFSFPGGIPSHAAPETPGSIHEGGELGYTMTHAYGAVLDNPTLIAAAVIGDGEAETGPLSGSWFVNKFLNPEKDGVVLPILHLNGFKINNPTILSRISESDLLHYFDGMGYKVYNVHGDESEDLQKQLAWAMDHVVKDINYIKANAKTLKKIVWPMIILRTPKGLTGPKEIVGTFKAHQVPFQVKTDKELEMLEKWLKSYKPENLFDDKGRLKKELKMLNPHGKKRMGANPIANGGLLLKDLLVPLASEYGVEFRKRGELETSDMFELGKYLKDVFKFNKISKNFRIFGPDEIISNKLNHVFDVENKIWTLKKYNNEEMLEKDGRILDSYLNEHVCQGALEGYLLTGRHGLMHSYEAFIRVVDSMASQHAKWLKITKELSWRKDIASLNYILSSHTWQQDHNGYTHQEPGFLNHIATKKGDITNIYLPIDANTLICSVDKMLKSKNKINVTIASKHPRPQWLNMKEAIKHTKKGIGKFEWASTDEEDDVDIVLTCAGDTATLESIAAVSILKQFMPDLKIRLINITNLFKIAHPSEHKEGLSDEEYDEIFTKNKPNVFIFHGYPSLIHQLVHKRNNRNIDVYGYNEEGSITTPFDMRVQNKVDRFNIALSVLENTKRSNKKLTEYCESLLTKHKKYIREHGKDIEEVENWKWKE